jgi:hypothetical protein
VCHCPGKGTIGDCPSCDCNFCNHETQIVKEENMVKKIIEWIKWPFKKVKDWLWSK